MTRCKKIIQFIALLIFNDQSLAGSDIQAYIEKIKSAPTESPEPIPRFKSLAKFTYLESANRRNPFQSQSLKMDTQRAANFDIRKQNVLQYTPIEVLKFVGFIKNDWKTWGLVSCPGGDLFPVVIGDYLGLNAGKIVKITESSLSVEEPNLISGKWRNKLRVIELSEKN